MEALFSALKLSQPSYNNFSFASKLTKRYGGPWSNKEAPLVWLCHTAKRHSGGHVAFHSISCKLCLERVLCGYHYHAAASLFCCCNGKQLLVKHARKHPHQFLYIVKFHTVFLWWVSAWVTTGHTLLYSNNADCQQQETGSFRWPAILDAHWRSVASKHFFSPIGCSLVSVV